MALFHRPVRHDTHPDSHRRRAHSAPHRDRFPQRLKRLDVLCHNTAAHPLPVKMKFISESLSDKGMAMGIYACTFHGCAQRHGWILDRKTGRPFRLWPRLQNR